MIALLFLFRILFIALPCLWLYHVMTSEPLSCPEYSQNERIYFKIVKTEYNGVIKFYPMFRRWYQLFYSFWWVKTSDKHHNDYLNHDKVSFGTAKEAELFIKMKCSDQSEQDNDGSSTVMAWKNGEKIK